MKVIIQIVGIVVIAIRQILNLTGKGEGIKMIDWTRIKYFHETEFSQPQLLRLKMIIKLDKLRLILGTPMIITSSCRSPEHNLKVGGVINSAHMVQADGYYSGIDFTVPQGINDGNRISLLKCILSEFDRVGLYRNHFHVDIEDRPQALWFEDKS